MGEETEIVVETDQLDLKLGGMVRAAAGADFALLTIAQNLCESSYGALLVSGETTERILTVCKTLIDAHDDVPPPQRDALRALITRARQLFPKRHQYVHGAAIFGMDGGLFNIRTRRLRTGYETTNVDLQELDDLRVSFEALTGELVEWLARSILVVPRHPTAD